MLPQPEQRQNGDAFSVIQPSMEVHYSIHQKDWRDDMESQQFI